MLQTKQIRHIQQHLSFLPVTRCHTFLGLENVDMVNPATKNLDTYKIPIKNVIHLSQKSSEQVDFLAYFHCTIEKLLLCAFNTKQISLKGVRKLTLTALLLGLS